MFRKNCKCKTKICKCGKRKIRGGVDEGEVAIKSDHDLGYYMLDDKDVYCFSDIEGNMPKELKDLIELDSSKKFEPVNIETKLSEKKAIVFTGDLIDRGANSIRNLWNMNQLKINNPTNVILVCGNRDLNKIRMYHECCIPYIEDNIFTLNNNSKTINEIFDLLDSKDFLEDCNIFKNISSEIAENINIPLLVNPHAEYKKIRNTTSVPPNDRKTFDLNFRISYRNDIYRIKDIYENTLGSLNQIKFFKDEFEEIFEINFGFDSNSFKDDNFTKEFNFNDNKYKKLLKFIAMMNMVMGKIWDNGILPECLKPYNGLYISYLQGCHIMAVFTKGVKLCFVSHSGVPYHSDSDVNKTGFYIPSEIGSKINLNIKNNKSDNIELIKGLNEPFYDFIRKNGNDYKGYEYKKYIAMSAACGDIDINGPLTSEASPVVSNLVITRNDQGKITTVYDKRDISLKNLIVKETDKEIKKIYNIYGHVPTGLLPTVRKNEDDNLTSYHIGLDISRAENGGGISNKLSYVYLKITEKDDTLTGKTITNLPYDKVIKEKDQQNLQKYETIKTGINIEYQDIDIDTYFKNKRVENNYHTYENPKEGEEKKPLTPIDGLLYLYTIDNKTFYGMHGFILVKYFNYKELPNELPKPSSKLTQSKSPKSLKVLTKINKLNPLPPSVKPHIIGGKNNKTYTKSNKRFMNGKRQMVIYLGKRGCEYVKTAGEYVSLTKFIKAINKNKK
jgi:hypothetical protein